MTIKQLIDEDFVNYKKPSMFIGFPHCSFKCEKECGLQVCQNSVLATSPDIVIDDMSVINRYMSNKLTSAIVLAGLEPFDDIEQLENFIWRLRDFTEDDIVIYTGYYKEEIEIYIKQIQIYKNIIVKFGRFIPNQPKHFDEVLGVELASDNQYAERIS